jgi:hypothetical protein
MSVATVDSFNSTDVPINSAVRVVTTRFVFPLSRNLIQKGVVVGSQNHRKDADRVGGNAIRVNGLQDWITAVET